MGCKKYGHFWDFWTDFCVIIGAFKGTLEAEHSEDFQKNSGM